MDGSKPWWSNLASELRQALFGAVFALILSALAAVLLAAFGGDVPAWTLAVVVVLAVVLVLANRAASATEIGRAAGEQQAEKRRREEVEQEYDQARERIADLEARASPPSSTGPLDPRIRGLLFRVQALRGQAQSMIDRSYTTQAQDRAIRNLARDVLDAFGPNESVQSIIDDWSRMVQGASPADLLTALGELEGALAVQDETGTLWNPSANRG